MQHGLCGDGIRRRWGVAGTVLAAGAALMLPAPKATAAEVVFNAIGAPQAWVVPAGVTSATFELIGGGGGESGGPSFDHVPGGRGALVRATLPLVPGEIVHIYVGGKAPGLGYTTGGWNGGGGGWSAGDLLTAFGGGGGATDIRLGGTGLEDRVLVAGGGGGGGTHGVGPGLSGKDGASGGAGGDAGQDGEPGADLGEATGGGGGHAPAPSNDSGGVGGAAGVSGYSNGTGGSNGAFGVGGADVALVGQGGGGGGGGGWYGGGGGGVGAATADGLSAGSGGGGGGSSYAAPAAADVSFDVAPAVSDGSVRITYEPPPEPKPQPKPAPSAPPPDARDRPSPPPPARVRIERRLLFGARNGVVGVPITCLERRCRFTVLLHRGKRTLAVRHRVTLVARRTGMVHLRLRNPVLLRKTTRVRVIVRGSEVTPRSAVRKLVPFGLRR